MLVTRAALAAQLTGGRHEGEEVGEEGEEEGHEDRGGHQVEIFCENNREGNLVCKETRY